MLLEIDRKRVDIRPAKGENRPIIYLNTVKDETDEILSAMKGCACPDCTLVVISGLEWNCDMSPWYCPGVLRGDGSCTGGADDYLDLLVGRIIPAAEACLPGKASWRGLAGYSLGGLFAVYSLYKTDAFSRIASCSGSLWFPDFDRFVFTHEMIRPPEKVYFSLGDKESNAKNPCLKSVGEKTKAIFDYYQSSGLDTRFVLNPGNHFQDPARRTTLGIKWILT